MSGTKNTNYVGYEKRRMENMEEDYTILDVMALFLDYVSESDDEYMPKEKIKLVVSDFLSDQNIPTTKLVNEDELEMLEMWNKSVLG